ncbi:eukaryotic translation initiation factor 4 gamma-like [Lathyrus oleraceus]|uniref:eukaryotic translation initiation factor 4 gamma-like n=1 Tax=Pisum sativum TaxID=3888 RepID=UPI0021CFDEEF|nr:eukaryotic translation initiation factor 4 gamma-like [Pisum sativum]
MKDHREISHGMYMFSKIDPSEVIAHYLQDLDEQGIDISGFTLDPLLEQPQNFTKRKREPSDKKKKKKKKKNTLNTEDSSVSQKPPMPLSSSTPSKSSNSEAPLISWSRWMTYEVFKLEGLSKQVRNDYIRGAKERLEARLVQEAEEKARKEDEEKARIEAEERVQLEVKEKVAAEVATAEAKVDAE